MYNEIIILRLGKYLDKQTKLCNNVKLCNDIFIFEDVGIIRVS